MNELWLKFCESGLNISTNSSNLAPCFQQICLHIPIYSLIAIFSAYEFGLLTSNSVWRNKTQLVCLNIRAISAFLLAVISPAELFTLRYNNQRVWPVDVLLVCIEFLAWTLNFGESFDI